MMLYGKRCRPPLHALDVERMDVDGQWVPDDGSPGFMFIGTTPPPHKFPRIWTTSIEWAKLANKRFRERFGDVPSIAVLRPSLDRARRESRDAFLATRNGTKPLPIVYSEEPPCASCVELISLGERLDRQVGFLDAALFEDGYAQHVHEMQKDRLDRAIKKADELRRDLRGMFWLGFVLLCLLFVNVVVSLEGV